MNVGKWPGVIGRREKKGGHMRNARLTRCAGCGAEVPEESGPTHRYLESAPACWRIYTELLARDYTDPAYYEHHRLCVDAYAVQHPGRPSPQTLQSAAVHLVRLYMILEGGLPLAQANDFMKRFAERDKQSMHWLEPPQRRGELTVVDVAVAGDAAEHATLAWKWAASAWNAWSPHHPQIRQWAFAYL